MTARTYVNPVTGRTYPLTEPLWRDPADGGYLDLTPGPGIAAADIDSAARGPWRYRKALALPADASPVTLGEGSTPLLAGTCDGAAVLFKMESQAPTGSFKDRGVAVMISYLRACGIASVSEDSSGNAGAAVAAYAAAAGMTCRIFAPAAASPAKFVQMRAAGAAVTAVGGTRAAVTEAAIDAARDPETFYASHNLQPFFLEGTKTLAFELWEDLGFRVPDAVVTPVGAGGNLLGLYRGFSELRSRGGIDRMPRLYAVQPAACAPLVAAFETGAETVSPVVAQPTVAEGTVIASPTRGTEMLRALRETGGGAVAVGEADIKEALGRLAQQGLFVEPTSAAAGAGLSRLLAARSIAPEESTVMIVTGHGLKAAGAIGGLLGF